MRAILISVKPEWVEKILNKEKTAELRTTCPKEWKDYLSGKTDIKPSPIKGYIYCTKRKEYLVIDSFENDDYYWEEYTIYQNLKDGNDRTTTSVNGRVIAEFTLNNVTKHEKNFIDAEDRLSYNFLTEDVIKIGFNTDLDGLCDFDSFVEDYGKGKPLYAWHIDKLKIYDKPKELSEFSTTLHRMKGKEFRYTSHLLQRPPQSWCYVEDLGEV